MGNNLFYTVMKVKGHYYLYKVIYANGRKVFIYVGPCEKLEEWSRGRDLNPGPPPYQGSKRGASGAVSYNPPRKLDDLELVITPSVIADFVRWCVEELGNSECTCRDRANYLRKPLNPRNSHSVKAYRLLYKMLGKEPPKELKVPKSGVDLRVPSDSEIAESLERVKQHSTLYLVYRLLIESGARLKEVVEVLKSYDPSNDACHGEFYTYVIGKTEGSKKAFHLFHVTPLKRVSISEDRVTKLAIELGLVRPKYVRKWVATKMLSIGIPAEIVDFIQGRTPRSILTRHYLNLYTLAVQHYPKYLNIVKQV
ncbi:MAG: integrase [Thermofilaceae archaeon]